MISTAIQQLVNYGLDTGLILPDDEIYIRNQLLMTMQLDSFTEPEGEVCYADLESILKALVDDAVARGVCDDSPTARDLFDTKLMGVIASGAILAAFGSFSAGHLITLDKNTVSCISGGVVMLILNMIADKKALKWVREWSLFFALFGGMLVAVIWP